jgi:hypothetical protein
MKVQITLEWDVAQTDVKEAKQFVDEREWLWDSDPMTAVHFMNQICFPDMIHRAVKA